jgi:hypothetical protein
LLLFLERNGYPEETYHTFSYSPLPDDEGAVGGMLCVVTEDTERVIGERRMATLRELASLLSSVRTEPDVLAAIERGLATNQRDMPFAIVYLFEPDGHRARLACTSGIAADHPMAAIELNMSQLPATHPASRILAGEPHVMIADLAAYGPLPTGVWDRPPYMAVAVPIVQQGETKPAGMLVAALNPYRPLSESVAAFSIWWLPRSPPASPVRAPMRQSGNAPRRWQRSTRRRPHSSPMSATNSARRLP